MSCYLVIDFGTGSCRGALVDEANGITDIASRAVSLDSSVRGFSEISSESVWSIVKSVILELMHKMPQADIKMIGVTSMTGYFLLDRQNRPLMPAMTWMDTRAVEEVDEIEALLGRDTVYAKTGRRTGCEHLAPKLLWLKKHRADLYCRISTFYGIKDDIVRRLTGAVQTDYTFMDYSLLFNIERKSPDEDICRMLEIDEKIFPKNGFVYDVAGELLSDAAEELKLKPGIPVIVGASDGTSAMYSSGIELPGRAVLVSGTTETLRVLSKRIISDSEMSLEINHGIDGSSYQIGGAMGLSGGSVRWLQDLFGIGIADIQESIAQLPPGSEGLVFSPGLTGERAPFWKPYWNGSLAGLTMNHGREHFFRALMEGVCFREKFLLEIMKNQGLKIESISIAGGSAESHVWNQIRSDILGIELIRPDNKEASLAGITRFCRMAEGKDYDGRFRQAEIKTESRVYSPDEENNRIYERYYQIFLDHLLGIDSVSSMLSRENLFKDGV